MQCRHYKRALHCHKVMLKCPERLLLEQCMLQKGNHQIHDILPEDAKKTLDELVKSPGPDTLNEAMADKSSAEFIDDYLGYRSDV